MFAFPVDSSLEIEQQAHIHSPMSTPAQAVANSSSCVCLIFLLHDEISVLCSCFSGAFDHVELFQKEMFSRCVGGLVAIL